MLPSAGTYVLVMRSRWIWIVINAGAVLLYSLVSLKLHLKPDAAIMFATPDSQEYMEVGRSILDGTPGELLLRRPYLYPVLIASLRSLIGVWGIWSVQALMWLASMNLVALAVLRTTRSWTWTIAAAVLMATDLSMIALTYHGLTEVMSIFLVSIIALWLSTHRGKYRELPFFNGLVILLAVLTIIRPVFVWPASAFLVLGVLVHHRRLISPPRNVLPVLIVIGLWVPQLWFSYARTGSPSISNIGPVTYHDYLFTQVVMEVEQLPQDSAKARISRMSDEQASGYGAEHRSTMLHILQQNVEQHIAADPMFLIYPPGTGNRTLYAWMYAVNRDRGTIHWWMLCALMIALILRRWIPSLHTAEVAACSALIWYLFITSGISHWQGDRLVITAVPLFTVAYVVLLSDLSHGAIDLWRKRKGTKAERR